MKVVESYNKKVWCDDLITIRVCRHKYVDLNLFDCLDNFEIETFYTYTENS